MLWLTLHELVEGLLDVKSGFGGGLLVGEVVLDAEVDNLLLADAPDFFAGLDEILLVGDDHLGHLVLDLVLDLMQPHAQILKTLAVGHVKYDNRPVALAVVRTRQRQILLCSCCVTPNLHVSQMFTRTSLAPTRNTTGAYSTPNVGVVFSVFLPTMKFSSEVLPTFKLPIRMTSCGPKYSGSRCSSNYSFNYAIHAHT